jgi:hypothetical protein
MFVADDFYLMLKCSRVYFVFWAPVYSKVGETDSSRIIPPDHSPTRGKPSIAPSTIKQKPVTLNDSILIWISNKQLIPNTTPSRRDSFLFINKIDICQNFLSSPSPNRQFARSRVVTSTTVPTTTTMKTGGINMHAKQTRRQGHVCCHLCNRKVHRRNEKRERTVVSTGLMGDAWHKQDSGKNHMKKFIWIRPWNESFINRCRPAIRLAPLANHKRKYQIKMAITVPFHIF